MIADLNNKLEECRAMHRKWAKYREDVNNQWDALIVNLGTAREDCLKDYTEVLSWLESHIRFLEGEPPE